jgi:hypothetical protein
MNLPFKDLLILFYLQRYSFLTIRQVMKALDDGRGYQTIGQKLLEMAKTGLVGFSKGPVAVFKKGPKIYYLKKNGYEVLLDRKIPVELLGRFREKHYPVWTVQTQRRLHLNDVFLSLEAGIKGIAGLELIRIFLEYNGVNHGSNVLAETTDFFSEDEQGNNKIVPDGAFILQRRRKEKRLFLVEMDMGTERGSNRVGKNSTSALPERLRKYEAYLQSRKYAQKYQEWGEFKDFTLLWVTHSADRANNGRKKILDLSPQFHNYYFLNSYDAVATSFFNREWKMGAVDSDQGLGLLDNLWNNEENEARKLRATPDKKIWDKINNFEKTADRYCNIP